MAGETMSRSPPKGSTSVYTSQPAIMVPLQQPLLSPRKEKGSAFGSSNMSHVHSVITSQPGSSCKLDNPSVSTPRRSESTPNLLVGSRSPSPATPGKLKCERVGLWPFYLWRWRGSGIHSPPPLSLQPSGLSWPAVFLLLAGVSALTALVTHGLFSRHIVLPRKPALRTISSSTEVRYWRRFESHMKASAMPSPNKQGQKMVVLVTGAAGFVGSHLALSLRERGDGVLGLDNFNNYYDPGLKRARENRLKEAGVFIVHGDINNAELLTWLFQRILFTHVAHMAAQAGVRYAMENPQSYVHSNVAGFVSVMEACRRASFQPAIVWASSSSVYGLNRRVPFSESHRTDRPASLYAATKKAGEVIAHSYNHIYGLSITGLRFFTVYGPWGRPDMAYFSFTRDILSGRPIKIFSGPGNADVSRDFTYIDDIVNGCLSALDTAQPSTGGKKGPPAQFRVFNLGNTNPVSVASLVSILEEELQTPARKTIIRMPRNGDVPFTHANVTAANFELGYRPATSLRTGLRNFVTWYLEHHGKNITGPIR